MFRIQKFVNDFNKQRSIKESYVSDVLDEVIQSAFRALDEDLAGLQSDVDSGEWSNQDIYDKIQDIRDSL